MSENEAANAANATADFGRDQRRSNVPEGRRPVEARDRAPEVYVEGEQVARLVETRRPELAPDAPATSWFDDNVPASAVPVAIATLERPAESAVAAPTERPDTDDRILDEFDVVIRGLDEPGSAMNDSFPRLGKQSETDIFDPAAFEFPPASDAPTGMMTPAVEPPIPGQGTVDLSGDPKPPPDFGDPPPSTGFGEPDEGLTMRAAVEPRTGDNSVDLGRGAEPARDREPETTGARNVLPDAGRTNDLPAEKNAPVAEEEPPTRVPGFPERTREVDDAIPARPVVEDLVASGRRELAEEEPFAKTAPPAGEREATPVTRETGPAPAPDSLDVFGTRPAAGIPAREPVAEVTFRSPSTSPEPAPVRTDAARTGDDIAPAAAAIPGVLPGKGFFDDAPARESVPRDMPGISRDALGIEGSRDEPPLPADEEAVAASRFDVPEIGAEELAPLKFDDEDNLDNE